MTHGRCPDCQGLLERVGRILSCPDCGYSRAEVRFEMTGGARDPEQMRLAAERAANTPPRKKKRSATS